MSKIRVLIADDHAIVREGVLVPPKQEVTRV
jgi:DNA-binding NarL/FixJ family response regulator